jgi:hypothetical protein
LLVAVIFTLLIAGISRIQAWLLQDEILQIALISVGVMTVATLLAVWLWPRPTRRSAQQFDYRFNLKERISTAFELSSGELTAPAIILTHQLEDARVAANAVQTKRVLPMTIQWAEVMVLIVATIALAVILLLDNPFENDILAQQELEAARQEQIEQLEETRQTVAEDSELTEEQVEELTEPIDEAIETLEQDEISQAEAVAALSEAEQELREMSQDGLSNEERQAYEGAANALSENERTQDLSDSLENGDLEQAAQDLENLSNELDSLSAEEQQALADQLEQAARELEQTNPALSEALQEASDALRDGDTQAAQEALQEASDILEQQAQENRDQAETAQRLADEINERRREMTEFGQENGDQNNNQERQEGQEGQQSQEGQNQQGQPESNNSQQGQPQDGQESQEGQQGQSGQEGEQQGQEGQQPGQQSENAQGQQPGSSQESQSGEGQPGSGEQEGQPGDAASSQGSEGNESSVQSQSSSESSQGSPGGSGAGDTGSNSGSDEITGSQGQQPGEVSNSPGDDDQREFTPENTSQRIGEDGVEDDDMSLTGSPDDDQGDPIREDRFNDQFTGESFIPYNQAFSQYQGEVQRALDSDYIPIDLRDIVHAYFTSIEPNND